VNPLKCGKVLLKRRDELGRHHRDPVVRAFPFVDHDLTLREIAVFHPQSQPVYQAQSTPVQQLRHEQVRPIEVGQNRVDFVAGEDGRQAPRNFGGDAMVRCGDREVEHRTVQEQERAARLILGGGGDVLRDGEVGEEGV
jgi:hypothetical protein